MKEKKYNKLGMYISIGVHAVLILIFFFLLAWRAPDPPIPEYGIVVNFGLDEVGSGKIQPEQPPVETKKEEEKSEESKNETQEEVVEESTEPQKEEEATKEVQEEAVKQPDESPVIEKKEEKKVEPAPKEVKEVKKEPKKKEPVTKPVKNPNTNKSENESSKAPTKSNQGDDPGKVGDKGKKEGTVDSRTLYGSQGGGGGASLDLAGWRWDYLPKPNDTSDESGRIVFEIKVDDQGEVMAVRTIEKTVSPAVEKIYKQEVESLTFSRTSDNTRPAPVSTGRITFIIKSK